MNLLYYGDNLDVLRRYITDESVDLVYLDPPFKSDQNYNVLFQEQSGARSSAQIKAFADTWRWDQGAAATYRDVVEAGGKLSQAMQALRLFLGDCDMLAYLSMMAPRVAELRRVLKPTGSIYLHCDPTSSHYLKLLMDAVFGPENFLNEIIWKRSASHSDAKRWAPVADVIFYYSRRKSPTWNPQHVAHDPEYVADKYRHEDADGRRYCLDNMTSPKPRPNMMYTWKDFPSPVNGWRYSRETMAALDAQGRIWYPKDKKKRPRLKRYLEEMRGVLPGTVWTNISPINSQAQERLGYPTQKPEALLERIISASSNEGDVVLDPFCGCGTAIAVAEKLKRRWIGIDITQAAMMVIKKRLESAFGGTTVCEVRGEPVSVADAEALAAQDPYQFQWWALGLVGARPADERRGADRGIDGRIYFHDEPTRAVTRQIILSVKSGHVTTSHIRDLRGVMDREHADIGVIITLQEPTQPMRREAASAGVYAPPWSRKQYPKIQIRTIAELLADKGIDYPDTAQRIDVTVKKASKSERRIVQPQLPFRDRAR